MRSHKSYWILKSFSYEKQKLWRITVFPCGFCILIFNYIQQTYYKFDIYTHFTLVPNINIITIVVFRYSISKIEFL